MPGSASSEAQSDFAVDAASFAYKGYLIKERLYTEHERDELRRLLDRLWAARSSVHDQSTLEIQDFRFHSAHLTSSEMRQLLFQDRLFAKLTALLSDEPVLIQSSFLYKARGSRGHHIHQDDQYTRVRGSRCLAAWTALDDADIANGCVYLLEGSQVLPVLAFGELNEQLRMEGEAAVHLPTKARFRVVALEVQEGTTVIWDGSLIHWSGENNSFTRLRRSLVCHYVARSAQGIASHLRPVIDREGNVIRLGNAGGNHDSR